MKTCKITEVKCHVCGSKATRYTRGLYLRTPPHKYPQVSFSLEVDQRRECMVSEQEDFH